MLNGSALRREITMPDCRKRTARPRWQRWCGDLRWIALVWMAVVGGGAVEFLGQGPVHGAQAPVLRSRPAGDALSLDVDQAAEKKFATIETHLKAGQFAEAIELLRGLTEGASNQLVGTTGQRHVGTRRFAHSLIAGLPPEGLQQYRRLVDPGSRPGLQAAVDNRDAGLARKLLEEAYCSSVGDDALWLLGDIAWEAGDLESARGYWRQLLPPPKPDQIGQPVPLLSYPDTDLELAAVQARIILCDLLGGQVERAERELAALTEQFPAATGELGGRSGTWAELLRQELESAKSWRLPLETPSFPTFAGSSTRQTVFPEVLDVGGVVWSAALPRHSLERVRRLNSQIWEGLNYFPVVYGDVVLVADHESIWAYELSTGRPAWGAEGSDDARIFQLPQTGEFLTTTLGLDRLVRLIGEPRHTLTVAHNRLFARMGPLIPPAKTVAERGITSRLICLDLVQQGKVLWETPATSLDNDGGPWAFEGAPLVIGSRVYAGIRRTDPQPQANVVCLDAETGRVYWNRKICGVPATFGVELRELSLNLLTAGEGALYYATQMGAVASLDPLTGQIRWLLSYPRIDAQGWRELDQYSSRGPLPVVYHAGTLYLAPNDSSELLAIDAETGLVKWQREFASPLQAILGVVQERLIVSGTHLLAVDVRTGETLWSLGGNSPDSQGYGRGLIAGDLVYWPQRENLLLVEHATGQLRANKAIRELYGLTGGNLLLAGGHLILTSTDRIAVISEFSAPLPKSQQEMSQLPPVQLWQGARQALVSREWNQAETIWQTLLEQALPEDRWQGRPLRDAIQQTRWRASCQRAESLSNQPADVVVAAWQRAVASAPNSTEELATLIAAAADNSPIPDSQRRDFLRAVQQHPLAHAGPLRIGQQSFRTVRAWTQRDVGDERPLIPETSDSASAPTSPQPWNIAWSSPRNSARVSWPEGQPARPEEGCVLLESTGVECRDLATGQTRWKMQFSDSLLWSGYSGPYLVLATPRTLVGVDPRTGDQHWRHQLPLRQPFSTQIASQRIQIGLHGLSEASLVSRSEAESLSTRDEAQISRVAMIGERIVVLCSDQRLICFESRAGGVLWDLPFRLGKVVYGPVGLHQNLLLRCTGPSQWWILDPDTGDPKVVETVADFEWTRPPLPLSHGGFAMLGSHGEIDVFSPPGPAYWTGTSGRSWSRAAPQSASDVPPTAWAVADDLVWIRDGQMLERLSGLNGRSQWTQPLPWAADVSAIANQVVLTDNHCLVARGGFLLGYRLDRGTLDWQQSLGHSGPWQLSRQGSTVIATTSHSTSSQGHLWAVCDAVTGTLWQRLPVRGLQGMVTWHYGPQHALAVSETGLVGLGVSTANP